MNDSKKRVVFYLILGALIATFITFECVTLMSADTSAKSVESQIKTTTKLIEEVEEELTQTDEKLVEIQSSIDTCLNEISSLEEKQNISHKMAENARSLDIGDMESVIEEAQSVWKDLDNKISEEESKIEGYNKIKESIETKKSNLLVKKSYYETKINHLNDELTKMNNNLKLVEENEKNVEVSVAPVKTEATTEPLSQGVVTYEGDGSKGYFKSLEPIHKITSKSSPQYKVCSQATFDERHMAMVDGRYLVAVGTGHGIPVGGNLDITLTTGVVLRCKVGDIKSDADTDSTHMWHTKDNSMIEFIVDYKNIDSRCKELGQPKWDEFKGGVVKVVKV